MATKPKAHPQYRRKILAGRQYSNPRTGKVFSKRPTPNPYLPNKTTQAVKMSPFQVALQKTQGSRAVQRTQRATARIARRNTGMKPGGRQKAMNALKFRPRGSVSSTVTKQKVYRGPDHRPRAARTNSAKVFKRRKKK